MTYGNLALVPVPSACREAPVDLYRARPAPAEAIPAPCPDPPPARIDSVVTFHPREEAVRRADRQALALRAARLMLCVPLASVAAAIVESSAWSAFGFARIADFARERLGRSGRWLRDLAALHERMRVLPDLEAALTGFDGGRPIGMVAALLVGRIASPTSFRDWIALARRATVRELRAAVCRARAVGSDEPPRGRSGGGRHVEGDPAPSGTGVHQPPCAGDDEPSPTGDHEPSPTGDHDDDPADRSLVRIPVPHSVRAAFDEAVDLYRAVEGSEATVTSFIDAIVAESSAGGDPPDVARAPIRSGPSLALIETALARSTNRWSGLPSDPSLDRALASARETLRRVGEITRSAGRGTPAALVAQMRALIEIENEIETRLGTLLAAMTENQAWSRLRFSGVGHYAEERLGLSRTAAEDRVRAARALRRYPHLRREYEAGGLGLEAVLVVARILDEAPTCGSRTTDEETWVARSLEATVKRLRDEARLIGRRGGEAADPENGSGHHPSSDAEWHASLRREPGTCRRRILRMGLLAAGLGVNPDADLCADSGADPDTVILPTPDVFLRLRLPTDLAAQFVATIETHRRRRAEEAGRVPWEEPWPPQNGSSMPAETSPPADTSTPAATPPPLAPPPSPATSPPLPSLLAARMFSTRCRRVPAWVGLLAMIEDFVLTWDCDARPGHRARDRIFVRDGWRCAAPGCSSRRNLEDHHVVYRSRGGHDGEANRICLCRFHHQRGEHGGLASCSGEAPLGITWRLGRQDMASWYRNERRLARISHHRS